MIRKKIKKLNSNAWFVGIIASIIATLILRVIDFFCGTRTLKVIWDMLNSFVNFFNCKYELPLYFLIVLFISGIVVTVLFVWILLKIESSKDENYLSGQMIEMKKVLFNYKRDNFNGVQYRWDYGKRYDGKYMVQNITPYCSVCNCRLVHLKCPNCNRTYYDKVKEENEIEPLILHRIEKGHTGQ